MGEIQVKNAFGVTGLELTAAGSFANPAAPLAGPKDELELQVDATTATGSLPLFDQAVKVSGKAGAKIRLHLHPAEVAVPGPFGEAVSPGAEQRWCEFAIDGALEAAASGTATSGPVRFSAAAAASAELEYRRLLPMPRQQSLQNAVVLALQGARFPGRFFDGQLAPGESHRFAGRLRFGLDLGANAGFEAQYQDVVELFAGFSPEIKATARATVAASLGIALFESTEIVVHRPADAPADRLRLRLARVRDRGVTLGVKVALGLQTNLGTVLTRTLDHVFALEPVAEVFGAWKEIAGLADTSTWEAIEAKLTKKATDTVLGLFRRYVDLGNSSTVKEFVDEVGKFLEGFDQIDERLQDFWADLLEHGGLGKESDLRQLLGKVAELGKFADRQKVLDEIVELGGDGAGRDLLRLVELLSGETVEELISSPAATALEEAVGKVAAKAKQILDLVGNGPVPKVVEALRRFAAESGIAGIVETLRSNASSVAALQAAVERPLRKVVGRLFHKAWEELESSELELLRQWAEKVAAELRDFEKWEAKLRADLRRLDEKFGFSLSFELSRQFHQEAFLDADLADRIWDNSAFRDAFRDGDLPALIRRLAKAATEEDSDAAIEIRECAFLTRRIRSTAWTLMLEAFGLKFLHQVGSLRKIETRETFSESSAGGAVEISGSSERYSNFRREAWRSKAELLFAGSSSNGAFRPDRTRLVLGISLEDDKSQREELQALDRLLGELGLRSLGGQTAAEFAAGAITRFGLEVQYSGEPKELVGALGKVGSTAANRDKLLAAVRRLYLDELVGADEAAIEPGIRAGDVMAKLLLDPDAIEAIDQVTMIDYLRRTSITVGGRQIELVHGLQRQAVLPVVSLLALSSAVNSFWPGKARSTAKALANAQSKGRIEDWEALAAAFTRQHSALKLDGYSVNPMLGFWVFLADLKNAGGALATHAAATLQKKQTAADEWSAPILWER